VCLRCQLSLATRGRARPSLFRTSNSTFTVRNAPSRGYSDSPEKPRWTGQLPIDEPQDAEEPWQGIEQHAQERTEATQESALPPDPPQRQDGAGTPDPWQGVFEQAIGDRKSDWRDRTRHDRTEDAPKTQQRTDEPEQDPVYRRIRVFSKAPAKSRHRAPVTLNTGPEVYTAKGQRLKPTNRSLPIDILGKPGHALVLRDTGPMRKKKLEQMAPDEPASLLNLAKIYESTEVDVPSSAEVLHNIHELQPGETVLPRREFEALKKTLYKGFTKAQLAAYIQKSSLVDKDKNKTTLELRPWILENWPWSPEMESDFGNSDALLQGYVSKSTTPKERLVIGLMRQCWGLGIQELQSQQGYLDVRMQDLQFDLLMRM
jgi:hypothetical protein